MPTMTTLEEKVRGALSGDDTGSGPISQAAKWPVGRPEATTSELDLRDWGVYYGVAFGIARGEDPYEPRDSVAARALEAAQRVYREYGGFVSSPFDLNEDGDLALLERRIAEARRRRAEGRAA